MGLRIWAEKVLLIFHIQSLDEETLSAKVYKEQKSQNWPGLAQETTNICKELEIEDCNTTCLNKIDYKSILMRACHLKNEYRLRQQATDTKCSRIKNEAYGKQNYVSNSTIEEARNLYSTRFGLQNLAGNYSHNRKFASTDWLCRCKGAKEEEGHIVTGDCPVYGDLRSQFGDLGEDQNLADFFKAVLDRRDSLEEEDRTWQPPTATVCC